MISRIYCTSKLMVGELSRHARHDTPLKIQTFYYDYSAKYRKLREFESNLVYDKNLTQRIVEQHFNSLKNVYLKGNKIGRLDAFVESYYSELKITKKLFSDCALHGCVKSKKSANKTKLKSNTVIASKFRKKKKTNWLLFHRIRKTTYSIYWKKY